MSPSIKLSLLALASTATAIPQYGHGNHAKFHTPKASANKAYPTGGWSGIYNSTAAPAASGTGAYAGGKTTTLSATSTSTHTLYSTVYGKPSSAAGEYSIGVQDVSTGQCGPATITVTASEVVTVTVGGDADVPASSAAPVESSSGNGTSSASPVVSETPAAAESSKAVEISQAPSTTPAATTPAAEYPAETPEAATSSKAEESVVPSSSKAEYPAETPEAATSSKAVESAYSTISVIQKPVASSATSSATPSASAAPGNTYTGAKRGLAYNQAELCTTFGSKFGFGYNWGQVENNDIGTEFIPMMHGPSKGSADEWLANVEKAVSKGSKAVMGFNECDHADQCNLSPEAACSAWKQYMNPVKSAHPDVSIIGPSVTNGAAPMGLDWLSRFHDCCPDATIDATNIHFYDQYDSDVINRFKKQVEKAAEVYGKPVWITEFGLNPGTASQDQAASFLKEAMAYLDGSDKVQGYSWFMVGTGENQLNSDSGLSAVGKVYAGTA